MKISNSKWIMVLIYLIIALPAGVFVAASVIKILLLLFDFVVYGLPIDLSSIDFVKILKGSIAGGSIGAIGCWWIYYQRNRQNR